MQARDRDAIRKFACWLAQHFDVAGFESLQIKTMTESAKARGGKTLKLPAMDSSETCDECGRIDPKSRKKMRFQCTGCAHENDADVNAARVMRARTLRWLELRANTEADGEAYKALWDELKARRKAHGTNTGGAGATTKPACVPSGQDNGGAGAPSKAPAGAGTPPDGSGTDSAEGRALRGHE